MAPHWACAQLHAQRERLALHCLQIAGFTTYLPRIAERCVTRGRMTDAVRPLFPTYCFVWVVDHWWSAIHCPGVIRLIMDGTQPARVSDSIISELRAREKGGYILPKPPGLQRGDRVHVTGGVFNGLDGLYDGMVPRDRIKILLTILGAARTVELPFDDVERARKRRVFEGDQPEV